jgi:hypothetical protein
MYVIRGVTVAVIEGQTHEYERALPDIRAQNVLRARFDPHDDADHESRVEEEKHEDDSPAGLIS